MAGASVTPRPHLLKAPRSSEQNQKPRAELSAHKPVEMIHTQAATVPFALPWEDIGRVTLQGEGRRPLWEAPLGWLSEDRVPSAQPPSLPVPGKLTLAVAQ